MPCGYVLYQPVVCPYVCVRHIWGVYIHIGVGFCVARSTGLGNAKAFVERDGQQVQTPALFSYMYPHNSLITCLKRGSVGPKEMHDENNKEQIDGREGQGREMVLLGVVPDGGLQSFRL